MHLGLEAQTEVWWFRSMAEVVITGMGLCTAMGSCPDFSAGTAVAYSPELDGLPHTTAAVIGSIDLKPWLKRRKDRKLMARPSQLALAAAGAALVDWSGARDDMGLYVGVGREPGDDGESVPALIAASRDGRLDEAAVAGPCRDLYPPLLPLKTLPNMALAHVSIHLDVRGENGAWCGGAAAGITAARAAMWSVVEGRCSAALIVAADTWVAAGAVRDLLRAAEGGPIDAPGEAGVALLVETREAAAARSAPVFGSLRTSRGDAPLWNTAEHRTRLGHCHAADALLSVGMSVALRRPSTWVEAREGEQPSVGVAVAVQPSCAWYDPRKAGNGRG